MICLGFLNMDKTLASSHCIQPLQKKHSLNETVHPEIIIPSGVREIDGVIGGFKAGTIVYTSGSDHLTCKLVYHLCITTYQTFKGYSIFIDSGTTVNPYTIAKYAREQHLPVDDVLSHVYISRAFTLHQLITILTEHLEPLIQQKQPQTLIINAFPYLYQDADVNAHESRTLLNVSLSMIRTLTKKYQLVTLLSAPFSHLTARYETVQWPIVSEVDEHIHITTPYRCPRVSFLNCQQSVTLTSYGTGQLSLPDFGMVT
jgi:hypothetical protein